MMLLLEPLAAEAAPRDDDAEAPPKTMAMHEKVIKSVNDNMEKFLLNIMDCSSC